MGDRYRNLHYHPMGGSDFNQCYTCKRSKSTVKCIGCPNFCCKECLHNEECSECVAKWYRKINDACDDFNQQCILILKPKL